MVEASWNLDALVATMATHSYSVLFSGDWQYNLNAGIILFRNDAYALKLLDDVEHGNVKEDFVEEAVQVFRFEPSRLELLANGESTDGIWDRFEWTRDTDGTWSEPRRLMPC